MYLPETRISNKRALQKMQWWEEVNFMVDLAVVDTCNIKRKSFRMTLFLKRLSDS
jgi:hypothetical protein